MWIKIILQTVKKYYKREKVIFEIYQTSHTRNSYYKHLKTKKHLEIQPVLNIEGKIHKYKKDGKRSQK